MAGEQQRKFEDRIIAAVEKAEIAHELLTLSTNSKRTLFLLLQKLSEQLGFIDDPRGWLDSPEKRQEAARSRVVGGVDLLTNQPIQNEQELHAVWASTNDPETIDLIGRAATGKLLVGAFRFIVEVYFRTWSKTPDSHYENFAESVGIIKSLVIAECRALWSGRLLAPSDMNPPASEELPWFDLMPRADVAAELEDEADRRSNQAREVELTRRAEVAEPVSSESIATELHHKAEAKNERLWHTWVMKPRRIALYARVSTKDKGQDTRNQQNQLRTYAAKQEWEIVAEYVDQVSGKTGDRPQFKAMMKAASMREFDLVLFWSLDRLSREGVLETLQHLQTLTSYGVGWKSFTEQYLDSCGVFRDAVLSILATIAKQERIRLSERTVAGLEKARKEGRVGGRPKVVTDRGKVRELRAAGHSLPAIAREMGLSITTVARICKDAA